MDSENIACRKYLMKNWQQVSQLKNQRDINFSSARVQKAQNKIKLLQLLTDSYIKYILANINQSRRVGVSEIITQLTEQLQTKQKQDWTKLLLGYNIYVELSKSQNFNIIHRKIVNIINNLTKPPSSLHQFQLDIDSSDQQDKRVQLISNYYAKQSVTDNSSSKDQSQFSGQIIFRQNSVDQSNDINIQLQQNYNSDNIHNQDEEVKLYLYKLSKSTTQLSYLCQRMKWPQPFFKQEKSGVNQILFSCNAQVFVRIKQKCFPMNGQCPYAVSKKQAKRIASLFLLRKIYNRIPQAWKKFKVSRQENPGIQQALNANNQQIFKKAKFEILDIGLFNSKKNQDVANKLSSQINSYLDKLKSFKSEINILIGKQKKISPPQITKDKIDDLSLWPVTATIFDGDQQLKAEAKDSSKKGAEQKCCRDLLFQIYSRNQNRWRKFVDYKQSKNLQ